MVSLKYAVVERERRFLVSKLPGAADERRRIVDRYVTATRLRLREVVTEDGAVTRKLGTRSGSVRALARSPAPRCTSTITNGTCCARSRRRRSERSVAS